VRKFSAEEREVYKGTPSDETEIGKQKNKKGKSDDRRRIFDLNLNKKRVNIKVRQKNPPHSFRFPAAPK
jgi:hypothetical protein